MKHRFARIGTAAAAVALIGGCVPAAAAFAEDATPYDVPVASILQYGLQGDYLTADDVAQSELQDSTSLPSALDLRHYNGKVSYTEGDKQSTITGGINYVTSVKNQNPINACWAFSSTAACETSLLFALDKADNGKLDGSVNYEDAIAGKCGDLAYAAADLSERHLAYFAFSHVSTDKTKYPSQASEGRYLYGNSEDAISIIDSGGMPWLSTSEYSSGIGPVPDALARYISDEGLIQAPMLQLNSAGTNVDYKYFTSYEEAKAYCDTELTEEKIAAFEKKMGLTLNRSVCKPMVARIGTWSVDRSKMYGYVAELSNSNVIASDKDPETGALTAGEITLMKEELNEGHALSIAIKADQSKAGETISGDHAYLNTETWAQYTYANEAINHGVTIVGYDDNYAKENFTHTVYKQDEKGNWVPDDEKSKLTTPAGDGAWIVKNSWGSADDTNPLTQADWGIDNSGYYYVSYYDKTISNMESYEFDVSEAAQQRESYVAYQHDLANVTNYMGLSSEDVTKMCNVFDGPDAGEGCVAIRDLGFVTSSVGDTVTLDVYVMNDTANVTETLTKATPTFSQTVENITDAGYHRMHLDTSVYVGENQKFAVVQTVKRANGRYECTYEYGVDENMTNAYNAAVSPLGTTPFPFYTRTVVNEGESFLYTDGAWVDLTVSSAEYDAAQTTKDIAELQTTMPAQYKAAAAQCMALAAEYQSMADDAEEGSAEKAQYESLAKTNTELANRNLLVADNFASFTCESEYAIDNFSIKAYADVVDDDLVSFVVRLYSQILDRTPDASGLAAQVDALNAGTEPAEIVYNLFNSDEYTAMEESSEQTVKRAYQAMFGRDADEEGLAYWKNYLDSGMSVRSVIAGFSRSAEYKSYFEELGVNNATIDVYEARDENVGVTGFASRLYDIVLNRNPDVSGLNCQCAALLAGTPCNQIAYNFFNSKEFSDRGNTAEQTIAICYEALLGRNPESHEAVDYWVNRLNTEGLQAVVNGFCQSDEFAEICAKYGMTSGM